MPPLNCSVLESLKKKRAVLEARIQAAEARTKHAERKQDTRRKILVGSYYLDKAHQENNFEALVKLLDPFLTRDSDRKLFNLPLKEPKKPQ